MTANGAAVISGSCGRSAELGATLFRSHPSNFVEIANFFLALRSSIAKKRSADMSDAPMTGARDERAYSRRRIIPTRPRAVGG